MKGTTSTAALALRQLRAEAAKERLVKAQARPMRRHESEQRLASLRTYHTRRGPELRLVQARPAGHSLADELPAPRVVQATKASDFVDWPELIGSFVVAVLLVVAGAAVYFLAAASQVRA